MEGITVPQLLKELRVEADHRLSTSIGARAAAAYEKQFGRLPTKDLRPKTSGGGTHCHAIYPPGFRDQLVAIIRAHETEDARQGDLF